MGTEQIIPVFSIISLVITLVWMCREIRQKVQLEDIAHQIIGRRQDDGFIGPSHAINADWLVREVATFVKERGLKLPKLSEKYADKILLLLHVRGIFELRELEGEDGSISHWYSIIPASERR